MQTDLENNYHLIENKPAADFLKISDSQISIVL
jgi:hypothetical protein